MGTLPTWARPWRIHPGYRYQKTSASLCDLVDIKFYGVASHAAGAPEAGISALEAQVFNGINGLRLSLPKDVNIHGIITDGGQAANVIPEFASAASICGRPTGKPWIKSMKKWKIS